MQDSPTILLVDDEDAIQKLLSFPLQKDGYRVVEARDGETALRRFDEEAVDLVILDLALPKLDGLEVCRRLRAHSAVPIIMLTARDEEIDKVIGLEIGADDYITKPFSIREFRSRVRALLRRASLAPRTPARRSKSVRFTLTAPGGASKSRARPRSSPTWSSSWCASWQSNRVVSFPGPICSRRSGVARSIGIRGRWTFTCAICARSSSGIRASPS